MTDIKYYSPINPAYIYVTGLSVEPQGCKQWSPLPPSCSWNVVDLGEEKGALSISCIANSDSAAAICDEIVRSLNIERTGL